MPCRTALRLPLLTVALLAACAAHADGVGLTALDAREPVTGTRVPAAVLYPSAEARADARTEAGPYTLDAQRDAAPAAGRFPLIVLSHGHLGSLYGHRDLAAELARRGAGDAAAHVGRAGEERTVIARL